MERNITWFDKNYDINGTIYFNGEVYEDQQAIPDITMIVVQNEDMYGLMAPQYKNKYVFVYRESDLRKRYR